MSLINGVVSIGTDVTEIVPYNPARRSLIVQNVSTKPVIVGGAMLSATGARRGLILKAATDATTGDGGVLVFDQDATRSLFGVVVTGTADVVFLSEAPDVEA